MKIDVRFDNPDIRPEITYLCRFFSTLLQAEFIPAKGGEPHRKSEKTIFYISADSADRELEKTCVYVRPNRRLWRSYLCREFIQGNAVAPLTRNFFAGTWENSPKKVIKEDIFFIVLFLISRYEEIFSPFDKDQHGRFQFKNDTLASQGIKKPIVNLLVTKFAELLSQVFQETISVRQDRPLAVISHDIDIPFFYAKRINEVSIFLKSFFRGKTDYKQGRLKKVLLNSLGRVDDPYDTYDYFNGEENRRRIRSTYFLLMSRENKWGLDLKKYQKRLRLLVENDHEIALHPGYESFSDLEKTKEEKLKVQGLVGREPLGTRSHFLRFNFPGSYEVREKLGFIYDSTLGYAEQVGFRGGVCTPFKPYDPTQRRQIDILEIPLCIMDGTLRDYQGLSPKQGFEAIKDIVSNVKAVNGVVVFNWHNSFFLGKSQIWKEVYENSLDHLMRQGFKFMTCAELAHSWSSRWSSNGNAENEKEGAPL